MSKLISVGEISTYKKGYAFKSKDYAPEGIPIVKVSDFDNHIVSKSSTKLNYEVSDGFEDWKLQKNDILIATVGSWATNPNSIVGKVVKVNDSLTDALLNQNCVRLRAQEGFDQKFLFYSLKTKNFANHCISSAQGSANQASITLDDIHCFMVPNFSLTEQQRISNFLSYIDDKIELNQKMNETLEEIAKTLFKSWFIDFDPVRAKAEGRPTGLSKEISDMFPDSFEGSEFGEIPKGWTVRSLGDFYVVNKGLSYKGKFLTEHGMPMINLGCFGGNGIFLKEKIKPYSGEFKERHIISKGDIAIANTDMTQNRITLGSPIMVDEIDGNNDFLFTHHVFCLKNISEREDLKYFTYQTLLNPRFRSIAGNYATGTTVLALPKDAIENFQVALPSKQTLNAFNEIAGLNFKKLNINYEESIVLGDLRDKLLPKLISGELKIPDAENLVEEAGI